MKVKIFIHTHKNYDGKYLKEFEKEINDFIKEVEVLMVKQSEHSDGTTIAVWYRSNNE